MDKLLAYNWQCRSIIADQSRAAHLQLQNRMKTALIVAKLEKLETVHTLFLTYSSDQAVQLKYLNAMH